VLFPDPSVADARPPDEVAVDLMSAHAPVVLGQVDANARITSVGGALLARLGYAPEQWVGRRLREVIDDETIVGLVEAALDGSAAAHTTTLNGRTWLVSARPAVDGGAVVLLTYADDDQVRQELNAHAATMALRVQEQRAISELGRLAMVLPLPELVTEAVNLVCTRYPSLRCGVLALNPSRDHARVVAVNVDDWLGLTLPLDDGTLTGHAFSSQTVTRTADIVADPRFEHEAPTSVLSFRAVVACPIAGVDAPWGVIGIGDSEPHEWTDDDVAFIESVAATVGAAVRRDELEGQLQHQSLHDPLTGLPNRALVADRLDHALSRAARRGSMLAVLLLDLDDFKAVNDSLGHVSGDELLSELAMRFESVVREGDTVARIGGDEFVVVCEDVASEDDVAFVAEALLAACAQGVEVGGRRLTMSASVGVALAVGGESGTTALLSEADIAMYRAKRDRPGTYRIFDEAMRGDVLGRMNIAGELRDALRSDGLHVAYQPIVDLSTGRIVALEALARWTNEAGEPMAPDVFIPVAEETGLIAELGASVLRQAVEAAAAWQAYGEVGLRVNASAHELRNRVYCDNVLATLESAGLPPRLLGLEITESVLVDDDKITQDTLARLSEAGVCLLIDDFGTGYSSLSYLQRFPVVDVLKIDRSFLGEGTRGEAVVRAVIGLGSAFDLEVCAEGVETAEQHARVVELGCQFAQGYYLARPMDHTRVLEVLSAWRPLLPGSSPTSDVGA
jgi:diguanylate cyclase (GGDEF)-like protein